MNLDGQRFLREEQLEEQSRIGRIHVRALKPEFSDRDAIMIYLARGPEIGASPGFAHNPHAGMFDRHDLLLVCTAPIWAMAVPIRLVPPVCAPLEIARRGPRRSLLVLRQRSETRRSLPLCSPQGALPFGAPSALTCTQ